MLGLDRLGKISHMAFYFLVSWAKQHGVLVSLLYLGHA